MNQTSAASDQAEHPAVALRLAGVSRSFAPGTVLLKDIALIVATGERIALQGESGVGKSTLLNLIAGLEVPDAGSIEVGGRRIDRLSERERSLFRRATLGFVFQAFHLLPHLSALQNVMVPLLLAGEGERVAREAGATMLDELGLAARADALPGTLSGGEQQRVAQARALIPRPRQELADEPTGNLDPVTAHQALELLFAQCARHGITLLMATHSVEAAAAADRCLRLTQDGIAPAR